MTEPQVGLGSWPWQELGDGPISSPRQQGGLLPSSAPWLCLWTPENLAIFGL